MTIVTNTTTTSVHKVMSSDLAIQIDGHQVMAVVDTGSHFSIISQQLADRYGEDAMVQMPYIRTAGGQLKTPVAKCTARLIIFIILRECSKQAILEIDFLQEYGAVINVCARSSRP